MDDTLCCPICNNKLRNINQKNRNITYIGKTANYVRRTCYLGMNHNLQLYVDGYTGKIDLLNMSLDHKYSKQIELDFLNKKCRVSCFKNGKVEYIDIPRLVYPDFPKLRQLKERISMYITFS